MEDLENDVKRINSKRPICQCGKVCFDKKTAQTKRNQLERMGGEKYLRVYQCPQSDYWHLTKATNYRNNKKYDR